MNFFDQTLLVASGTIISQLISLAATPLLARLYDPHQFGLFAIFTAMTGAVAGIACLRFDVALGVAKDDELPAMMSLALVISCIVAAFSIVGLYFLGDSVSLIAKLDGSKFWLPFAIITGAMASIVSFRGIRQGAFFFKFFVKDCPDTMLCSHCCAIAGHWINWRIVFMWISLALGVSC
jgi:O-antigen/teichoic acid export membrane protein